jgi:hypothetical protein
LLGLMPRAANRHRQINKTATGADSAEQIVAFEPIAQIYLPPAYRCGRNGGSDVPLINRSGGHFLEDICAWGQALNDAKAKVTPKRAK